MRGETEREETTKRGYEPWTKEDVERLFDQIVAGVGGPMQLYEEVRRKLEIPGETSMKRKIMTITYTCPEDKANLGEAEIMGSIIQKLGELGAYDIAMKASSTELVEPMLPKVKVKEIQLPEFMEKRDRLNIPGFRRLLKEGEAYGKTV